MDFAQARYYSSKLGRFYSVDPENVGASEDDPQSWNGYVYARNNPIIFTDSDGLDVKYCDTSGVCVNLTTKEANATLFNKEYQNSLGNTVANDVVKDRDGNVIATYENDNPITLFARSVSDNAERKAKVVGVLVAGAAGVGVCVGVPALCPAAKQVVTEVAKNLLKRKITPEDLRRTSSPGTKTKGKTTQFVRKGGMSQATQEFNALNPSNVQPISTTYGPGMTGTLPNGSTVTVRPGSSGTNGKPTLEIRRPNGRGEEYRYDP